MNICGQIVAERTEKIRQEIIEADFYTTAIDEIGLLRGAINEVHH